MLIAPLLQHDFAVYTLQSLKRCIGLARCGFVYYRYKAAFQVLKLYLGKGGLKPPVASPLRYENFAPLWEQCL